MSSENGGRRTLVQPAEVEIIDDEPGRSKLLWVVLGLLALVNVGFIAALLLQQDESAPTPSVTAAIPAATATAAPEPTVLPTTEPTAEAAPTAVPTEAPTPAPTTVPTVAPEPTPDLPPLSSLPPRGATYREGKLYLEGPVPSDEIAQQFVAKAAEVIGADNVINNYVIRPDAPIPTDGHVRVASAVIFASGSAEIASDFDPVLNLGVAVMSLNPQVEMAIAGHTDSDGDADFNLDLSIRRAVAVKDFISSKGIDSERFTVVGRGEGEPIADNSTEEGRAANRRIEVDLLNLLLDPES